MPSIDTLSQAVEDLGHLVTFEFEDNQEDGSPKMIPDLTAHTETIDIAEQAASLLNPSGSFLVNDLSLSSFGKLLQALPIPAMLIDRSCSTVFYNDVAEKMGADVTKGRPESFLSLLLLDRDARAVREMVHMIFADRKRKVMEAILQTDRGKIWGRIHLRSIRLRTDRLVLLLIEDLTAEKKQLILAKKQEQRMREARNELEQRVVTRTAELTATNRQLKKEVADRVQAQEELRKAHDELEKRVDERTHELVVANRNLKQQILARRKVEAALRQSEEKYRAIVENIEEGYYEVDLDGKFVFVNDSACRVFGYDKDEIAGKGCHDFLDEQHEASMGDVFSRVRTTGKSVKAHQCELTTGGGTKRDVEISVSLVLDSSGRPVGFRGLCRDITDIKRADEELRKLEKLESLGVLAGGIAHDFNNILTALQGNIALAALSASGNDRVTQLLDEAEKASMRAQALTRQLLTFSKGGTPIKKTVLVDKLAKGCCEFALTGSNVRCQFDFPEDLWPVEADEGQIGQVFSNLAINANQAMEKGGVIHVRGENVALSNGHGLPLVAGTYVRISFTDQGCGIPSDNLGKIFDPYYTTKADGNGLGLASSYSIIKRHKGVIRVESKLNEGSTFHVYLPASENQVREESPADDEPTMGKGRILLMDDDDAIRQLGSDVLSLLGYEAEVAEDGAEAVGLYLKAKDSGKGFDAVIMDLTVPGGMGGYEATQMLRQIDPNVKAIVSSGYSNDPVMAHYRDHGFSAIIKKPYSYRELGSTLGDLLSAQVS
ncbi:MAG: PAS domain S-box protein [Desulfomonile tiedjei]|nr:PAS domain S-box protein [Desulfomonile tiedjei]